jgi:hypothetical protein
MNNKISSKAISLTFGVLVLLFAAGFYVYAAWQEPTAAPPGGNVPAPLNVGVTSQIKSGNIGIGTATLNAKLGVGGSGSSGDTIAAYANSANSALYAEQAGAGYAGYFQGKTVFMSGNVGIGDSSPASLLTIGSGDLFQVNSSGNIVKIRNITYSWPSSQGAASTFLRNDGSGNLTWVASGGSGTVTSVAGGYGLTGGTITTSGTLSVDTTTIQTRVSGTCAAGSSIRVIAQDGTVTCESSGGSGAVTSVGTGFGLLGGPITTTGSLYVNTTTVQTRVTTACATGTFFKAVAKDGTATCIGSDSNNNTFLGSSSGLSTTGALNSAFGYNALASNTTGYQNSAFGAGALSSNNVGYNNSAFGYHSLAIISGYANQNSAFGYSTLAKLTSGDGNSAFGYNALANSNINAWDNTAIGNRALEANTTGDYNTAVGVVSLDSNTDGSENTAIGMFSLPTNTTGFGNTAVGRHAGDGLQTGSYNTFLGSEAGYNGVGYLTTGSYNTFLGTMAGTAKTDAINSIGIGYMANVTASNQVVIGNSSTTQTLLKGNVGIGTANPSQKLDVAGYVNGTGLCINNDCKTSWAVVGGGGTPAFSGMIGACATCSCPGGFTAQSFGAGGTCANNTQTCACYVATNAHDSFCGMIGACATCSCPGGFTAQSFGAGGTCANNTQTCCCYK